MVQIKTNTKTNRNKTFILEILWILLNGLVCAHGFHTHLFPQCWSVAQTVRHPSCPLISDAPSTTSTEGVPQM